MVELKSRRILVMDREKKVYDAASEALVSAGAHLTHVSGVDQALHRIRAWKPHLVLADCASFDERGAQLGFIEACRSVSLDEYVAIVFLCEEKNLDEMAGWFSGGADDFLIKPVRGRELFLRLACSVRSRDLHEQIRRAQQRIEDLTTSDELTGLHNMKFLFRQGEDDVARCRRFRKPVSALLIDIDHFSSVNEANGFHFGSHVIREVGGLIRSCVRKVDRVARVGSDEYFVLLPETDLAGAQFVAERIRDTVQGREHRADKEVSKVTVSIGVAGFAPGEEMGSVSDFFRNTNEALRSAKIAGANRIEVFSFA